MRCTRLFCGAGGKNQEQSKDAGGMEYALHGIYLKCVDFDSTVHGSIGSNLGAGPNSTTAFLL